jgi:hypothetical protein
MASERNDRRTDDERERRRVSRPSRAPSEPILPPLISDGPELVRDSHC